MSNQQIARLDDRHTSLTSKAEILPAAIPGDAVPATVREGIKDLMIAFPAGPQQEFADKRRLAHLFCEACAGYSMFIVEQVLRYLRFHNPRNPFPPTPQDAFELCKKFEGEWTAVVVRYYFKGQRWGYPSLADYISKKNARLIEPGGEPQTPECIIPREVVFALLGDYYLTDPDQASAHIADLSDEHFARLPRKLFTDEGYSYLSKQQRRSSEARKEYEERMAELYPRAQPRYQQNDDEMPADLVVK